MKTQTNKDKQLIKELNKRMKQTHYRVTDIAKAIGCSQHWLSRILNGKKPVSDKYRRGLELALQDLNKLSFLAGESPTAA